MLSNFKRKMENIHKVEIARSRVNELAKGNAYVHQSGGGGNSIDSSTPTPGAWPKFIRAKLYKNVKNYDMPKCTIGKSDGR